VGPMSIDRLKQKEKRNWCKGHHKKRHLGKEKVPRTERAENKQSKMRKANEKIHRSPTRNPKVFPHCFPGTWKGSEFSLYLIYCRYS